MIRVVPLLLLLAACGGGVLNESLPQEPGPDAAACREEVLRDPDLRRIASAMTSENLAQNDRVRRELREGIARSYNACMIRRGARPQGGVEPVRPGWW
jgi:hypothetical protein